MSFVTKLNALALDCIAKTQTPPPHAARFLAIFHTAIYDAWALHKSEPLPALLAKYLRRSEADRTKTNRRTAMNYAAFGTLRPYFETILAEKGFPNLLADELAAREMDPKDESLGTGTAASLGNLAAKMALSRRDGDGSNVLKQLSGAKNYADWTDYAPRTAADGEPIGRDVARWQPLLVPQPNGGAAKAQIFLAPHWGQIVPFALRDGAEFRPILGPERFESPRFRDQCRHIIELSAGLTDTQKAIAGYWADGPGSVTPPGHWCSLAAAFSARNGHGSGADAQLFFALSNALMDAGIACWDSKRHFDYCRPVTAIRHLFKDEEIRAWAGPNGGTQKMPGRDWHPFQPVHFVTPPFAEFPSGHSTFSAAAAEILKQFTGADAFGGSATVEAATLKNVELGAPSYSVLLEWRTFSEAAAQAGRSRLFGGIHFEDGNEKGLEMGKKVGEKVWAKCARLFAGD